MSGKNPEIAVLAGDLSLGGRRVDYFLFRRDDLELEGVCQGALPVPLVPILTRT